MTEEVTIDPLDLTEIANELTPRDIIDFQRQVGVSFKQAVNELGEATGTFDLDDQQAKCLVGLVWVVTRKKHPGFTWDEALDVPFAKMFGAVTAEEEGETPLPTITADQ